MADKVDELLGAPEAEEFLGDDPQPAPDMSATKAFLERNLKGRPVEPVIDPPTDPNTGEDMTLLRAIEAGWQVANLGLALRGRNPDIAAPEKGLYHTVSELTTGAIDLPVMLAGGFAGMTAGAIGGGAAGSAVPVIGTATGAALGGTAGFGAGAMALPTAIREILMDHYANGDFRSFGDFWNRAAPIFLDTTKAGVTGGATSLAGLGAVKVLGPAVGPVTRELGKAATEVATMVTVGKALDRQVPTAQDFIDAAIMIGGLKAAGAIAPRLRAIYAKTGVKPTEVMKDAAADPAIRQEVLSSNIDIPKAYEAKVETAPRAEAVPQGQEIAPKPPAATDATTGAGIDHKSLEVTGLEGRTLPSSSSAAPEGDASRGLRLSDGQPGLPKIGLEGAKINGPEALNAPVPAPGPGPVNVPEALNAPAKALGANETAEPRVTISPPPQAPDTRSPDGGARMQPIEAMPDFIDQFVRDKPKGELVPDRLFAIGQAPHIAEAAAQFSPAFRDTAPDVLLSSKSLKHMFERRGDKLGDVPQRLPELLSQPGRLLPNPTAEEPWQRPWYVVEEGKTSIIMEVRAEKDGMDVVNIITPVRQATIAKALRRATDLGIDHKSLEVTGLEGRNLPSSSSAAPEGNASRGLRLSDVQPGPGKIGVQGAEINGPERSDAEKAVLARITPAPEETARLTWDKTYTAAIDELHPLKTLGRMLNGEKPLAVKDDPYALARLTRGAYGKADQFLEYAPFDFTTLENTGKPLKAILKPFRNDLDGLRAFAVASRAVELEGRGIATGVPLDAARETVARGAATYGPAVAELQDYQGALVRYLKDAGLLSEAGYQAMLDAGKSYVPFYRLMEEGAKGDPAGAIGGSGRPVIDPVEAIIKNTYMMVGLAERNRVMGAIADLADRNPDIAKDFVEKVTPPARPLAASEPGIVRFLKENGIDAAPEEMRAFGPSGFRPARDEIAVFREGRREVYKVAPEVADAVGALDRQSVGLLLKILAFPARALRAGETLVPDAVAGNIIRDQMTAFVNSRNGFIPVWDFLRSLGPLMGHDAGYQAWLKSGGANAAMVAIDRDYIRRNVFKLNEETGFMKTAWNVVRSPLEMLRIANELSENATRLGEFRRAMKGDTSAGNIFAAGLDSREVTFDFARVGAQTRAVSLITAFWNEHVQGLDRMARAFRERPTATALKAGAAITLPSVMLWWANHDDPRWKEIPRWQKDLFWIVMTRDHVYRIPKPQAGIIFGSLPERALEAYFDGNPRAYGDFARTLLEGIAPSYLPTVAQPVIEQFANRSTVTGAPLVPSDMEGILPEYQYTSYTSETAKLLGRMVARMPGLGDTRAASPIILENYIRAWSGGLGQYALRAADEALIRTGAVRRSARPAATLADLPAVSSFMLRYPSADAQSIAEFDDRYARSRRVIDTVRALAGRGEAGQAMNMLRLEQHGENLVTLDGIAAALSTHDRMIRLITENPEMKPEEKRQLIDSLYNNMILMARKGVGIMDQLDGITGANDNLPAAPGRKKAR